MKLKFKAECCTDGDFHFENMESLLTVNLSSYKGTIIKFTVDDDTEYPSIELSVEGERKACERVAIDLFEHMMVSLRVKKSKYSLLREIMEILTEYRDAVLFKHNNICIEKELCGNYEGTVFELKIDYEDVDENEKVRIFNVYAVPAARGYNGALIVAALSASEANIIVDKEQEYWRTHNPNVDNAILHTKEVTESDFLKELRSAERGIMANLIYKKG